MLFEYIRIGRNMCNDHQANFMVNVIDYAGNCIYIPNLLFTNCCCCMECCWVSCLFNTFDLDVISPLLARDTVEQCCGLVYLKFPLFCCTVAEL